MGLRAAVASGNWSNPAIWNGGVLPGLGDVVASNAYTVTIDQDINVDSLTNASVTAVSAVPLMTNYTAPSGIVTTSGEFNTGYSAWRLFDRNAGTSWFTPSSILTGWVAYEFTSSKVITSYTLNTDGSAYSAKNWTFEAWDGTTWVVLDTVVNNLGTVTRSFTNTTAYIQYRINISANNGAPAYTSTRDLYMYETNDYLSTTTAGGGFILNDGVTLTTTGTTGLSASSSLIDFSSNGTATINCGTGNIVKPTTSNTSLYAIRVSGGGTLNVTGNISFLSSNSRTIIVNTTAGATLNFTGNINAGQAPGIATLVSCTVNIVGNIFGCTTNGPLGGVDFMANGTLNITGDVYGSSGFNNNGYGVRMGLGNLNITGNIYGSTNNQGTSDYGVFLSNIATVYITGNIYGGTSLTGLNHWGLFTSSAVYLSQVGGIYGGYNTGGLTSSNNSAINILTGPFISSPSGIQPFYVARMHYQRTMGSYYEFRDSSTLGALPPSPPAPATRLVSPDTVVDAPVPSDVRDGVSYSLGTFTGTLKVPSPNSVSFGVPTDDTFGTAVLRPEDVWNAQTSAMNTDGSIGKRLKNASTVDSTGDQLTSLL